MRKQNDGWPALTDFFGRSRVFAGVGRTQSVTLQQRSLIRISVQQGCSEQSYRIPSLALGSVERVIGSRQYFIGCAHARMMLGDPGADGEWPVAQLPRLEPASDPLGERHGPLEVRSCENREELFAPEASGQIHAPGGLLEDIGEDLARFVPSCVPVAVVVALEAVQVEKDHAHQTPALCRRKLVLQEDPCVATVGEVGQPILEGHPLHPHLVA